MSLKWFSDEMITKLTVGEAIGVVPVDLGLSRPLQAKKLSGSLLKLGKRSSALLKSSGAEKPNIPYVCMSVN